MKIQHKPVKSVITRSKLPGTDYAVNPYVGCPHKCVYCYACFMKRFTGHDEPWGEFLDVKEFPRIKHPAQYNGKTLFFGSVTDPYNPYEARFKKTREILEQFVGAGADICIATKSDLVVRDLEILRQIKNVRVFFSINTLDEDFRKDMDQASSILERIRAMRILSEHGIYTGTFISPIFPGITSVEDIVRATSDHCRMYWLENLNLRGSFRQRILGYIDSRYPHLSPLYKSIYRDKNKWYWKKLKQELEVFTREQGVATENYFFHEEIRKK